MDDMNAFERQVAGESPWLLGPERPVDDAAIFGAIASSPAPRWRLGPIYSATRLVVAGVIVALFGGFLLAGALTTREPEGPLSPGASASAEASADLRLLPGVELEVEETDPGVYRVLDDGVRDLSDKVWDVIVARDGSVWVERHGRESGNRRWGPVATNSRVVRLGELGVAIDGTDDGFPIAFDSRADGSVMAFRPSAEAIVTGGDPSPALDPTAVDVLSLDGDGWTARTDPATAACVGQSRRRSHQGSVAGLAGLLASDGTCWLGTEDTDWLGGEDLSRPPDTSAVAVVRISPDGEEREFTFEDIGLPRDGVGPIGWAWAEAPDGRIWTTYGVFHLRGLVSFDGEAWALAPFDDTARNQRLWHRDYLAVTPDGVPWVAIGSESPIQLRGWDGDEWRQRSTQVSVTDRGHRGLGLDVDENGALWFGGLIKVVDDATVQTIGAFPLDDNGRPRIHGRGSRSRTAATISHATDGLIWLTTEGGRLYVIDPEIALDG